MLPTVRHRSDISSNGAPLAGRNDAEMGPAKSLHASAYCGYNERFDLIYQYVYYLANVLHNIYLCALQTHYCDCLSVSEA